MDDIVSKKHLCSRSWFFEIAISFVLGLSFFRVCKEELSFNYFIILSISILPSIAFLLRRIFNIKSSFLFLNKIFSYFKIYGFWKIYLLIFSFLFGYFYFGYKQIDEAFLNEKKQDYTFEIQKLYYVSEDGFFQTGIAKIESSKYKNKKVSFSVNTYNYGSKPLEEGQTYIIRAKLENISKMANSSSNENALLAKHKSSFKDYLISANIKYFCVFADVIEIIDDKSFKENSSIFNIFNIFNTLNFKQINRTLDENLRRLPSFMKDYNDNILSNYSAIFLGNRSSMSKVDKKNLINTGTIHLFAISGLHIGVIASFIYFFLGKFCVNYRAKAIICIICLWFFIKLVGEPISAQRAFLMISIYLLAKIFYRKPNTLTAISISLIILLIENPYNLINAGFLLSYCAVLFIILYGVAISSCIINRFRNLLRRKYKINLDEDLYNCRNLISKVKAHCYKLKILAYFRLMKIHFSYFLFKFTKLSIASLVISFSAFLGTFLILIDYFARVSIVGILLSAFMVLLASAAVYMACFSLIFYIVGISFLSEYANLIAYEILYFMNNIVSYFGKFSWSCIDLYFVNKLIAPVSLLISIIYLYIYCLNSSRIRFSFVVILPIFFLILIFSFAKFC